MADLEQIIAQSVQEATETGSLPDPEGDDDAGDGDEGKNSDAEEGADEGTGEGTGEGEGQVVEGEGETPEQKAAREAAGETPEEKEFQAILKELSISPTPKGRNNRMPYSRHLRTLVNSVKKDRARLTGEHTKTLTERDARLAATEAELANFREVDRIAGTDPDKYIGILAALYPDKYKRFLTPGEAKVVSDQQLAEKNDPMPEPDQKYADGTVGFSPEQWAKREAWNRREAVREAEKLRQVDRAELDKKLEPLLKQQEAAAVIQQRLPVVRANIANAKEVWGEELYNANETAILAALKSEDAKALGEKRSPLPFAAVVATVLAPKLHERANKARELALAELKKAPKAATSHGTGTKKTVDPDEPRDLEAIIRESIAASGLKG